MLPIGVIYIVCQNSYQLIFLMTSLQPRLEKMQFYVIFLDIRESIQSALNITRNNWSDIPVVNSNYKFLAKFHSGT